MYRYFKRTAGVGSLNYIYFWKSKDCLMKGLILLLHLIIVISYYGSKIRVKFNGSYLKPHIVMEK